MTKELPRYYFRKGDKLSENEIKGVVALEDTASERSLAEFPPLTISTKRQRVVDLLVANHVMWIQHRTGLDVHSRMPNPSKINFFAPDVFVEMRRKAGQFSACGAEFVLRTNEINVKEKATEAQTLFSLNHELAHNFSSQGLRVRREMREDGSSLFITDYSSSGYSNQL